jgi:hypothetical protein
LTGEGDDRDDGWASFVGRLASALEGIRGSKYLILEVAGRQRFVQFAGDEDGSMRAEAISNAYLPPHDQLTVQQLQALDELGWRPPTHEPDVAVSGEAAMGSPNHYIDFPGPAPCSDVALIAVRTLRDVFGAASVDDLEYHAFERDGPDLDYPGLCRRRLEVASDDANQQQELETQLLDAVRSAAGLEKLEYDDHGEIRFGRDRHWVAVRLVPDRDVVSIRTALAARVPHRASVMTELNDVNADSAWVRVYWRRGEIVAELVLPARPLHAEHVRKALHEFGREVDRLGPVFAQEPLVADEGARHQGELPAERLH